MVPRLSVLFLLFAISLPGMAGSDTRQSDVVELFVRVEQDKALFLLDSFADDAPVLIQDGVLWIGPDAARALRWARSLDPITLHDDLSGYDDLGGVLLVHVIVTTPNYTLASTRVVLARGLPDPPASEVPDRMEVNLASNAPLHLYPPLVLPAGLGWSQDGAALLVTGVERATHLQPGSSVSGDPVTLELPLTLVIDGPVPKGEPVTPPEPEVVDAGTITLTYTAEIIWHGTLDVEIVE